MKTIESEIQDVKDKNKYWGDYIDAEIRRTIRRISKEREDPEFNTFRFFDINQIAAITGYQNAERLRPILRDKPHKRIGSRKFYNAKVVREMIFRRVVNSPKIKIEITEIND